LILEKLADSEIFDLTKLTLSNNEKWFREPSNQTSYLPPETLLCMLLEKQNSLKELDLSMNSLQANVLQQLLQVFK